MDVARLGGGGGPADGVAPPVAEGARAVGRGPVSGRRHPDLVQGRRSLPLPRPGEGPQPGLSAPTGAPATEVRRQEKPQAYGPLRLNLLRLYRAGRTSQNQKYSENVSLT